MLARPTWDFVGHEAKVVFWVLLTLYWVSESIVVRRMRAGGPDKVDDRGSLRLLALVFPLAWWSAIALVVPILVVLINRIRVEEDVLVAGLESYREYVKRTYRLIPGVY
jgi:hypothetical protein